MSWCWLAFLPEPPSGAELADALASATATDPDGHPAGLVAAWPHGEGPARLADDPFARVYPARILRVGPGVFGWVAPPAGPAIQRYGGKPWPAAGFDSR
jgi:hypothetical protein